MLMPEELHFRFAIAGLAADNQPPVRLKVAVIIKGEFDPNRALKTLSPRDSSYGNVGSFLTDFGVTPESRV